jgi:putative metallohydrolase (TIGR04338 family)
MKRPRDSQKTRLYTAEQKVFGNPEKNYALEERLTLAACQAYVDRLYQDPWFRETFRTRRTLASGKPPAVLDGRGASIARGNWARLKLPRWARNETTILHEVAHAVKPAGIWEAAHGREYAARYLLLVQHYLGRETAQRLRQSFRLHRVKYTPKRQMTPEALERLRARGRALAAAHFPPYRAPKEG